MISWNVTFDESSFRAARFDLNSTNTQVNPSQKNKSLKGLLTNDVQVAGQNWSKYLSGPPLGLSTTIDVQIVIDKGPGSAYTESPDPTNPSKGSAVLIGLGFGSANTYQSEAAYKVNTLLDPNFSKPDIVIHISSDYLKNAMWLDPSTFQLDTPAAANKQYVDAVGAFEHEIGHALGFNGLLYIATGMPQTNAVGVKVETPFDEHVVLNGNMLFFDGPNAKFIYGDRVPLYFQPGSTENVYHLASYSAPILNDDLLNGGHFLPGTHYDTSNLDLAILADSGVNVDAPLTKASFSTQTFAGRVEGQSESINQLFAAKDPDGESITLFAVFNTDTNAGHFHIPNGSVFLNNQYVPTSGDQPGGQVIYMSPSDFASAKFVIGNTSGLNNLYCSAYDGHEWGPWAHMTVSTAFT